MPRQTFLFLFALILGLTAVVYWQGLDGGFWFDDYGQIVFNPAIEMKGIDPSSLVRAAKGSNSGPWGRPISMVSFALDHYFFGLQPFPYKLDNLLIHLVNVALVASLASLLLCATAANDDRLFRSRVVVLAASAWWALHPLCVTSVLYVVQRMTSLSSLFTLLGLICYCRSRVLALTGGPAGAWEALSLLGVGTVLSVFCKEIGLLAPAYAAVIEIFVFRFESPRSRDRRVLKLVFIGGGLACAFFLAGFLLLHPQWMDNAYANRSFNMEQRLLTEARILWLYLRLMSLPTASAMA